MLPKVGLGIGLWAILPPYIGPTLNVVGRKEIADHVIPGIVVILISAAVLVMRGHLGAARPMLLPAGLLIALCGFWMTATHVPLLGQAFRHQEPAGVVAWHVVPGLAVLVLGVVWSAAHLE